MMLAAEGDGTGGHLAFACVLLCTCWQQQHADELWTVSLPALAHCSTYAQVRLLSSVRHTLSHWVLAWHCCLGIMIVHWPIHIPGWCSSWPQHQPRGIWSLYDMLKCRSFTCARAVGIPRRCVSLTLLVGLLNCVCSAFCRKQGPLVCWSTICRAEKDRSKLPSLQMQAVAQ